MQIKIKVELLRKSPTNIPQCKRYQAFGHTRRYCNREPTCVKCAGKHSSQSCTLPKETEAKCADCRLNHPANYRGCIVVKEYQRMRTKSSSLSRNKSTNNQTGQVAEVSNNVKKIPFGTDSYSSIVKNDRQDNETTVKNMLSLILDRLNNQDKTIKTLSEEIIEIV